MGCGLCEGVENNGEAVSAGIASGNVFATKGGLCSYECLAVRSAPFKGGVAVNHAHPVVIVLPEPAATTDPLLTSRPTATGTTSRATTTCPARVEALLLCVVSLRRRSHASRGGPPPFSSTPLHPIFILFPRHLRPTGPSAPIISSIPIHLLRCTAITAAAATTA